VSGFWGVAQTAPPANLCCDQEFHCTKACVANRGLIKAAPVDRDTVNHSIQKVLTTVHLKGLTFVTAVTVALLPTSNGVTACCAAALIWVTSLRVMIASRLPIADAPRIVIYAAKIKPYWMIPKCIIAKTSSTGADSTSD
jgi:hypothetical protein